MFAKVWKVALVVVLVALWVADQKTTLADPNMKITDPGLKKGGVITPPDIQKDLAGKIKENPPKNPQPSPPSPPPHPPGNPNGKHWTEVVPKMLDMGLGFADRIHARSQRRHHRHHHPGYPGGHHPGHPGNHHPGYPGGPQPGPQHDRDLFVTGVATTYNVPMVGGTLNFGPTIMNDSPHPAHGVLVQFFVDGRLVEERGLDIAPGQSAQVWAPVPFDHPGPTPVMIVVDPHNVIPERDEGNNEYVTEVHVQGP